MFVEVYSRRTNYCLPVWFVSRSKNMQGTSLPGNGRCSSAILEWEEARQVLHQTQTQLKFLRGRGWPFRPLLHCLKLGKQGMETTYSRALTNSGMTGRRGPKGECPHTKPYPLLSQRSNFLRFNACFLSRLSGTIRKC